MYAVSLKVVTKTTNNLSLIRVTKEIKWNCKKLQIIKKKRKGGKRIEEMQSAGLLRNGEEDVQGGAFLAGWRRKMVSSALEKLVRYPNEDVR